MTFLTTEAVFTAQGTMNTLSTTEKVKIFDIFLRSYIANQLVFYASQDADGSICSPSGDQGLCNESLVNAGVLYVEEKESLLQLKKELATAGWKRFTFGMDGDMMHWEISHLA